MTIVAAPEIIPPTIAASTTTMMVAVVVAAAAAIVMTPGSGDARSVEGGSKTTRTELLLSFTLSPSMDCLKIPYSGTCPSGGKRSTEKC